MAYKYFALYLGKKILKRECEEESSSSSDEDLEIITFKMGRKRLRHQKISNYMETVARYSLDDFQSHFRLTKSAIEEFMTDIGGLGDIRSTDRPSIPSIQAMLLTLWTLATQESFREIGVRFEFSIGHAHTILMKTVKKICSYKEQFIKWPRSEEDLRRIPNSFQNLKDNAFPNVVGCVDGCHIQIPGTRGDNSYYNRKGVYSVNLQGVCNSKMKFTNIYVGWPGSTHDARVWRNFPIYEKLKEYLLPDQFHLLGDTAYPLEKFIMVPFRDNGHLTRNQKKFNLLLSSSRVIIEHAFGRLKGVWRRLKYLNVFEKEYLKFIICAACILHDVSIKSNIPYEIRENVEEH